MDRSTPGRIMLVLFTAFFMLMIAIPFLYPYGSFTDLGGTAGVIENWDALAFANPLTRTVYSIGDLFCHQEMPRSFIINGSQMAFCQRDVCVLAGFIVGLLATDKKICPIYVGSRRFAIAGLLMTSLTFIEWGIELGFSVDVPAAKMATGVLTGIGIAAIVQYAVAKEYEKTMGFKKEV
ncbi:MAG: DUF2085 domain-containing protein [Methanomassiliicoccaceae archaeon]|nr:DUF2085 domain-containing protein [Methanomassiliicoccaceae archaeon]